jgi:hypothetical protein
MTIPLIIPNHHWYCPNCRVTDVTHESRPHVRMHTCAGLRGLTVPLLPLGTKAKIEAVDRQDYVGKEKVQTDANGRPVQAVVTTRDEGQDVTVYAPTATSGGSAW